MKLFCSVCLKVKKDNKDISLKNLFPTGELGVSEVIINGTSYCTEHAPLVEEKKEVGCLCYQCNPPEKKDEVDESSKKWRKKMLDGMIDILSSTACMECLDWVKSCKHMEKKEECRTQWEKNGSTYICIKEKPCPDHDNRCTKCNGTGKFDIELTMNRFDTPMINNISCQHCNGTGKEPRKEKCYHHHIVDGRCVRGCLDKQDTRTHAWEMKTYTQDEVRKMLEDLKMRDNLAGNSKEVQEDRKHMNAKIDKKIAEL